MRLASLNNGTPDGQLVIISPDGTHYAPAPVPTLQHLMENWEANAPALAAVTDFPVPLDTAQLAAPMPRAWQWLDGSVYASHGELMDKVIGVSKDKVDHPLMYQGVSDTFYGPRADVPMVDEALGIDFEGEFGIIVDAVPAGVTAQEARKHIRLVVQINDWSLRALAGPEMKTGFGWLQAKPPCAMAPFAITPDELGAAWKNHRPCLHLRVSWNGKQFGDAFGEPMEYGFDELVAHAARTRNLVAGTVIGSGTVSNPNFREVGSSCIAERRGIEIVDEGEPKTGFMKYGDSVQMEAHLPDGSLPFGVIDQKVIKA
ncbi:MAG: fumarylacetoacetate hydrolase family protein [Sphingomonadaceae bacterium]